MPPANDDQLSESESGNRLDRLLDTLDGEILKWVLILAIGAAGTLLGDVLPPKALGTATAILLFVWITSALRVRRLKKRISESAHRPPAPAIIYEPPPAQGAPISELGYTLLCLMYDNWDKKAEWFPNGLWAHVPGQPPEIEIGMELNDLVAAGFVGHNPDDPDNLYLAAQGGPEPGTYYIEDAGKRLVRDRRACS